jgi:(p)ppGpp synthase/HD superfamily hydrolase
MKKVLRPPGYELFFAPLEIAFEPNDLERIRSAYIFSKYGHAKQLREGGGRYFDHPKRSAWIIFCELMLFDVRAIIAALMHDMEEDSYLLSAYRVKVNFGAEVALDLRALTKLPKGKETTTEYLLRVISRGPWATIAKLADRLDNLRDLAPCSHEKKQSQINETREYHLKLLVPALRGHGGEWARCADMLERLIHETIAEVEKDLAK